MIRSSQVKEWRTLERQDWQVWFLSTLLLLIVGAGLLSFMFPAVFWSEGEFELRSPERAFFGFGLLYAITLGYLLWRHATIRQLRRQLLEANEQVTETARNADIDLLHALPSQTSFRDSLAMEFRRASLAGHSLGAAIVSLPSGRDQLTGAVARIFVSVIRPGESLFRISDAGLAVILPRMDSHEVAALVSRVESAANLRPGEMLLKVVAYPHDAASLAEMESCLRSLKLSA